MNTIFINSRNCKRSVLQRLLVNLRNKINLKRSDKYDASKNLKKFTIHWKV